MSSGAIPARGAFSAHMKLPESTAGSQMSRSSAPPSVLSLSIPHSGYEHYPDHRNSPADKSGATPGTVRRSMPDKRSSPSPVPRSPPPPPPSRLQPRRAASVSAAQPIRKPSTIAAQHHPESDANWKKPSISTRGASAIPDKYQQQERARHPSIKHEEMSDRLDNVGINMSTNGTSEDEYQARAGLVPIPSVHPIDTLAKKLRQQALELTVVYEQLEKKSQALEDQEKQTQELKFQLESLKCAKQNSKPDTKVSVAPKRFSSTTATTRQSLVPKASTVAAAATSKRVEELQKQVQELEQEREQHKLSTKRIEKALADLKLHQDTRRQGHQVFLSTEAKAEDNGDLSSSSPELLLQEQQQLYIRVLEEAVHLKASELHVTGHEELLIVLAELRHTIYQQEQDVADTHSQVERLQAQLHEQNEKQLAQNHQLDAKSTKRELEIYELRQEKANLASQLSQVQGQLQRESEQTHKLQKSVRERSEREAHLREQLTSAVQLKTLVESKVDKLTRSSQETLMKLEHMTGKYEHEAVKASQLAENLAVKQVRFEELKVLQDELLRKLDSYSTKAESATLERDTLQAQFEEGLVKEQSKVKQLDSLVATKEDELRGSRERVAALELRLSETQAELESATNEKWRLEKEIQNERLEMETVLHDQMLELNQKAQEIDASEHRWSGIQEAMMQLDAAMLGSIEAMKATEPAISSNSEEESDMKRHRCEATAGLHELKQCARSIDDLMTSICHSRFEAYLPSLQGLVERIHSAIMASITGLEDLLGSWARERVDLRKAEKELQKTTQICEMEMRKVHQEHLGTRERCNEISSALADEKRETLVLRHLNEELNSDIEALRMYKNQVVEQNHVIATFKRQIEELNTKLQTAESAETQHKAALAEKVQHIKRLYEELQELTEKLEHFEQMESALERAAELTEQQNARNEEVRRPNSRGYLRACTANKYSDLNMSQLTLQAHDLESLRCDHEESLEGLKAREKAFSERFRGLFRQYCEQLHVGSSSWLSTGEAQKKHKVATTKHTEMLERLRMYEDEEARGDVVRLVQVFPMLLEDFVSISSSTSTTSYELNFDEAIKPQKARVEPSSYFHSTPIKRTADSRQMAAVSFKMDTHPKSSKVRPQRPSESRVPPWRAQVSSSESESAGGGTRESLGHQRSTQPSDARHSHAGSLVKRAAGEPYMDPNVADDACLREQLERIWAAFQSFKHPQPTATVAAPVRDATQVHQ